VRPDAKSALGELVIEVFQAALEPGARDADLEVLETQLEKLAIRQ
jgi:hypothetical protein